MPKPCKCKTCVVFRKTHDFEYLEIFSLDHTVAKFLIPRLIAFKKQGFTYPVGLNSTKWNKIIGKMIKAFKTIKQDDYFCDDEKQKIITEGLDLFREYFQSLWI